jgi:hypothetical protein
MDKRTLPSRAVGIGCIAIGVALALISGFAETIGIGGGTFGPKQIAGVAVGCIIALAGLTIVVLGPPSEPPTAP